MDEVLLPSTLELIMANPPKCYLSIQPPLYNWNLRAEGPAWDWYFGVAVWRAIRAGGKLHQLREGRLSTCSGTERERLSGKYGFHASRMSPMIDDQLGGSAHLETGRGLSVIPARIVAQCACYLSPHHVTAFRDVDPPELGDAVGPPLQWMVAQRIEFEDLAEYNVTSKEVAKWINETPGCDMERARKRVPTGIVI
jgi:hypothetical protein